jgi:hypothetical protein
LTRSDPASESSKTIQLNAGTELTFSHSRSTAQKAALASIWNSNGAHSYIRPDVNEPLLQFTPYYD